MKIFKNIFNILLTLCFIATNLPLYSYASTNVSCTNKKIDAFDGYIYQLKQNTTKSEIDKIESKMKKIQNGNTSEIIQNNTYTADSLETINKLVPKEALKCVEPNYRHYTLSYSIKPNDKYYKYQKIYYELLGISDVWSKGIYGKYKGEMPIISVIDTGVSSHPDLDNILKGERIIDGKYGKRYSDIDTHGTFVSGIISAKNNNKIGISGIMPDTYIYPILIFKIDNYGQAYADTSDIVLALNDAVKKGVNVINLSFGSKFKSTIEENAIKKATNKKIIVIAPVGNDNKNDCYYPAAYNNVIAVSSINKSAKKAGFSNYSDKVDVAAPGSSVISTIPVGTFQQGFLSSGYAKGSGTSFSAPYVSALAGLYKKIKPSANYVDFRKLLKKTSFDLGKAGKDSSFGYGVVDYANAYSYLLGNKKCKHSYGKWKTVISGTKNRKGIKKRTCKKCIFTQRLITPYKK